MNQINVLKRNRLIRLSWAFFSLTVVFLVIIWLQLSRIRDEFKVLTENELRLNRLSGQVVHLDEVLTMSTHMAATTGDAMWEQRHRENAIELDSVIVDIRDLASSVYESDANIIAEKANSELNRMEQMAFDSVREGNLNGAQAILQGGAYQEQKRIYSDGISHLLYGIDLSVKNKLDSFQSAINVMLISIGIALVSMTFLWITALYYTRLFH